MQNSFQKNLKSWNPAQILRFLADFLHVKLLIPCFYRGASKAPPWEVGLNLGLGLLWRGLGSFLIHRIANNEFDCFLSYKFDCNIRKPKVYLLEISAWNCIFWLMIKRFVKIGTPDPKGIFLMSGLPKC